MTLRRSNMSNFPYLLLILLLAGMAPQLNFYPFFSLTPFISFLFGLGIYLLTLAAIYMQSIYFKNLSFRRQSKEIWLTNLELVTCIFVVFLALKSQEIFHFSLTFQTLFAISLYFIGLAFFYRWTPSNRWVASHEIRFLIPFTLPLLFFNFVSDLLEVITPSSFNFSLIKILIISVFFTACLLLWLPYIVQKIWKCKKLEGPLRLSLDSLCFKAQFPYKDLKIWGVLNNSLTAAILGTYPSFRYILFTQRLIDELPKECIEAILCHEIGHNKHKHLLLYPFIIIGMAMSLMIFSKFFDEPAFEILAIYFPRALPFAPLLLFFCYLAIILIYFRCIFGFFSRLFERQADLYVFSLGLPSASLIQALDYIGTVSGNTHRQPNWHHYSIQERIDFLKAADSDRRLIGWHNRLVRIMLYIFLGCLLGVAWFLYL